MKLQYIFAKLCFDATTSLRFRLVFKNMTGKKAPKKGDIPFAKNARMLASE